jgi:hypothetical protein
LSPSEWSVAGHAKGELWTLEAIKSIRHQVDTGVLSNIPQNIKGCTEMPLLDSVPVSHYIVSVLHIIIGMGNILVEVLLEWIEDRVEKLSDEECEARNAAILFQVQYNIAKEQYDKWLENDGIVLMDKTVETRFLQTWLGEKDDTNSFVISDREERRTMKSTIDINRAEMKRLTAEKKRLSEVAKDAKKNYNALSQKEIVLGETIHRVR